MIRKYRAILVVLAILLSMACKALSPDSGGGPQGGSSTPPIPDPATPTTTVMPPTVTEQPDVDPVSITQTYIATTSPVQGSIEVAPGVSVIGGTAGGTTKVLVVFKAESTAGKMTEMRLDEGEWEPFVPQKEYTITIALNWSTIYHCVEYRDEKGNVSARYCDNKAVEGSPKP